MASIQWQTLSIDCEDADAMADFYSRLLGWEILDRGGHNPRTGGSNWVRLQNPGGLPMVAFGARDWYARPVWPEEAALQQKMMHMEIGVDNLEASVTLAVEAGGRPAPHQPPDRDPKTLRVMLDPSGHPFCLYTMS